MKRPMMAWFALLLACNQPAPDQSDTATRIEPPSLAELTAADSAAAIREGEATATAVAQGLAQRLQKRLEAAGPVGAVDFCSQTALALTDSLVRTRAPGVSVKRTSTKIRNPRNGPDPHERAALAWFDSARALTGANPAHYVQVVSEGEVRFYRPLTIAPFCTQCHGPPSELDPQVRQILEQRYPQDQATGYKAGDMRGLIRVSLPRALLSATRDSL